MNTQTAVENLVAVHLLTVAGETRTPEQLIAHYEARAAHSPLAQAVRASVAADEADRAVQFAQFQASATAAEHAALRREATEHAEACLRARGGWTVETLGHNVESAVGMDLDADECDEIAREAMAAADCEDDEGIDAADTETLDDLCAGPDVLDESEGRHLPHDA